MARPKHVEVLDKKFMGKSVSNLIKNTPVDIQRVNTSPLSQEQVEEVKKRYNIKTFNSQAQFNFNYYDDARRTLIEDMRLANKTAKERGEKLPYNFRNNDTREKYLETKVNERLNSWYSYYQHRELLILSGQYEELRAGLYKEQYLKHLKLGNISGEVIKNIENLSLEDWQKLIRQPDAKVDSVKNRELPALSNIYSYTPNNNSQNIENEIKEAFKSSGIEFVSYPEENADDIKRKKFAKMCEAYYEGRLQIYDKGNGHFSVPLLGSTDGKNAKIVKEFIEYVDKHSDEYQ